MQHTMAAGCGDLEMGVETAWLPNCRHQEDFGEEEAGALGFVQVSGSLGTVS